MNDHESTTKTIKRLLRPVVRRTLSPRTVQNLRFRWWCFSDYLPRLGTSHLVKRSPRVRGFSASSPQSSLAKELESVNLLARTEMCRVMSKFGSDKAKNNYTPLYAALFEDRCEQPLRIVELGLGTNNPSAPSNMGIFGAPGASLRGWRRLFPRALVYGADIDRNILFREDRIKTFYCDQLDQSSIRELWSQPDLQGGSDIIIEDGLHTFEANISFLEGSLNRLRPGGIYVTEDIGSESINHWYSRIETLYLKQYPNYEFAFVVMTEHGSSNLFIARRAAD